MTPSFLRLVIMCLVTLPLERDVSCLEVQETELALEGTCMLVGGRYSVGEERRADRAKGSCYANPTWGRSQQQGEI